MTTYPIAEAITLALYDAAKEMRGTVDNTLPDNSVRGYLVPRSRDERIAAKQACRHSSQTDATEENVAQIIGFYPYK